MAAAGPRAGSPLGSDQEGEEGEEGEELGGSGDSEGAGSGGDGRPRTLRVRKPRRPAPWRGTVEPSAFASGTAARSALSSGQGTGQGGLGPEQSLTGLRSGLGTPGPLGGAAMAVAGMSAQASAALLDALGGNPVPEDFHKVRPWSVCVMGLGQLAQHASLS